jgi:triacylglycerol lipase
MMMARLQRLVMLLGVAIFVGGGVRSWATGDASALGFWILAGVIAQPLWLALGFGVAQFIEHRTNPHAVTPAAGVIRAWLAEIVACIRVFGWRQPWRAATEPDAWPEPGRPSPGVLWVHGYMCNRGFWNPWLAMFKEQGLAVAAINLEPIWAELDSYGPTLEAAYQRWERAGAPAPWVVAHSMGGLVVRAWLRNRPVPPRIAGIITLGTPHHGTWLGYWSRAPNARQMRPHSAWLRALERDELAGRGIGGLSPAQVLNIYSPCDNIVFPSALARDGRWTEVRVPETGHVQLAERPEVRNKVLDRVCQKGPHS